MMSKPKILEIMYDIDWFIDNTKKECEKRYNEYDIDCAFRNLNLIYSSISDVIYRNKAYYSKIINMDFSVSTIHHYVIRVDSAFKFSKLIHSDALYKAVSKKLQKFANCYYPAIQLIDIMLTSCAKLLDNHRDEIWKVIISGGDEYQHTIIFTASRIDDTDNISFVLSIYPVYTAVDKNGSETDFY